MTQPENNLREIAERELEPWGIKLGVPMLFSEAIRQGQNIYFLEVPTRPHVFFCKELRLQEKEVPVSTLTSTMVILGHGYTLGEQEEDWRFVGTGKGVSETVQAYEATAAKFQFPPLDTLIVCRNNPFKEQRAKVRRLFTTRGIPYIYADSNVTVKTDDERWANWLIPDDGVQLMIADAKKWNDIPRWKAYWEYLDELRVTRSIPKWAMQPKL